MGVRLYGWFMVLALFLLAGCNENRNDIWYMQHPAALKKAVMACQSAREQSKTQEQCDRLLSLAESFQDIVMDQQAHPEEFGQRIMAAEGNAAKLKEAVKQAEAKQQRLQLAGASTAEIRSAQDDLYKAKKALNEQEQQIKILLAVVALSSPE